MWTRKVRTDPNPNPNPNPNSNSKPNHYLPVRTLQVRILYHGLSPLFTSPYFTSPHFSGPVQSSLVRVLQHAHFSATLVFWNNACNFLRAIAIHDP